MKIRLLSARNVLWDTLHRHPLVASGLSLLGLGMFAGVYAGFRMLFDIALKLDVLSEAVFQIFYFLFLFLLAGAVPFVASTLLQSADYSLLFAAPLPSRAVVAAKLLDATVTNSLQFTVLGIPAIVACAAALGLPIWGWVLLPLVVALFALLPALIMALGLLIALAVVGMRRLRSAITLVNAITGAVVCITIVGEVGHQGLGGGGFSAMLTLHSGHIMAPSPAAHLAPSSWFAALLLALAQNDGPGLLIPCAWIVCSVGLLFAACMALGSRLLSAANVAEEGEGGSVGLAPSGSGSRGWKKLFKPPVAAILGKDFKYLQRDSVLLSQMAMPLILFCVPFLLALQEPSLRDMMYPLAAIMIGIILFMQTSILSLSSIGLESRSFWLLLTSPNGGRRLLWAKFVLSTLVPAGVGVALTLISGLLFGTTLPVLCLQVGLVILSAAALCGLGVGLAAAFPRFVYENPAHRVSAWAMILGFFTSTGYLMATGLIFGLVWLLATHARTSSDPRILYLSGAILYLALTTYTIYLPMALGAHRIERYQWEH